jgi:hypothetical protein
LLELRGKFELNFRKIRITSRPIAFIILVVYVIQITRSTVRICLLMTCKYLKRSQLTTTLISIF